MNQMKIRFILLLMSAILIGCNFSQADNKIEGSSRDKISADKIQANSRLPDDVLFKGENMIVIEKRQDSLKPLALIKKNTSCLDMADIKIIKNLSEIGIIGNTKYFEFEGVQSYSSRSDKFIVNFDEHVTSRITLDSLKQLDKYVGFTVLRYLYYLENNNTSYLLLIGLESATSGLGHYQMVHLLVPLDSDISLIKFRSISDDPRRIGIADSGAIYFTQIDYKTSEDNVTKPMSLAISLFTIDSAGNRNLETNFDINCGDINSIFDKERLPS